MIQVNLGARDGLTPLEAVVMNGHKSVARHLLRRGDVQVSKVYIEYASYDTAFSKREINVLALLDRIGIHCIYDCKIYDSVVDLLMKLAQFWYFGHASKSLVAKST